MRVEDLRAGTLVGVKRVTGMKPGWDKGQRVITVTFGHAAPGQDPDQATYKVGQHVPGSPRMTCAFLPASDTRRVHDGHRGRRARPDREETARERRERREALRLALAAA